MKANNFWILKLWFTSAVIAFFAGCGNPCEELASKICDCKYEVLFDRESCKRMYIDLNPRDFTDKQKDKCDELLDVCTCDDIIQEGEQGRCGLANIYR